MKKKIELDRVANVGTAILFVNVEGDVTIEGGRSTVVVDNGSTSCKKGLARIDGDTAWGALKPNDVTSGVEDHENVFCWCAYAYAGEILAASLGKTRDDGAAETGGGSKGTRLVGRCGEKDWTMTASLWRRRWKSC
ncbi:unnamed protein product [Vicia faba]|uniref:Uncharacterized protein n=1 Tax=Vicia faba TaxID=3906 RepID=A0AAV1A1R2_VICFA|nr:unnamed protein product [Vicia faba]